MAAAQANQAVANEEQPTIIVMNRTELQEYVYDEEELHAYADHIGLDLENEYDLLWIAQAGLKSELPEPWKPCRCADSDEIFFFNFQTGDSEWEHPCDNHFRNVVLEQREKRVTRALTLRSEAVAGGLQLGAYTLAGELAASIVVAEPSQEAFQQAHNKLVASMELPEHTVAKFILPSASLLGFSHLRHTVEDVLAGNVQPPATEA